MKKKAALYLGKVFQNVVLRINNKKYLNNNQFLMITQCINELCNAANAAILAHYIVV